MTITKDRKGSGLRKAAVLLMAALLLTAALPGFAMAETVTASASGKTYSNSADGENAVLVNGSSVTLTSPTVTKSGDASGDDADFYGTNAAVLAKGGATLKITGGTVTTDGSHANAVFSYGSGTTVEISDTTIVTKSNNSGGIMTTGGGTTKATDLTVTTYGNSSAAIRSDRGGGTVTVSGGTYTTGGVGSPAIYSTAAISVKNAELISEVSEAIVIEGGNSVTLTDCTVTGNNTKANGQATNLDNVFIYQSMSGDASEGKSSFTMTGGTLTAKSGDMFYITNTTTDITLEAVTLKLADGDLLKAAADAWGSSGSNGGHVTLTAIDQELAGEIEIDSISELSLNLTDGSAFTGAITSKGTTGVAISGGSTWTLTADSSISSLNAAAGTIDLNGHTLTVNGSTYDASKSYTDDTDLAETTPGSSGTSGSDSGNMPDGEPPARPGEDSSSRPEMPADGQGGEPPARPGEDGAGAPGSGETGTQPPTAEDPDAGYPEADRIAGSDRYETALLAAEQLRKTLGVESFDAIVVASGTNYADALAGSYLADLKKAPILLTASGYEDQVISYIEKYLSASGTVYLLGGTASVSASLEKALAAYDVVRLQGADRYATDLAILNELTAADQTVLVCSGKNYPDSLSASALGMPVLLTGDALTAAQKEWLADADIARLIIIGGTGSVSAEIARELAAYGDVERISGADRYATSAAAAKYFFAETKGVVLAGGTDYPDGLAAGPLAYALGEPVLLIADGNTAEAAAYVKGSGAADSLALGGKALVSNRAVYTVMEQ